MKKLSLTMILLGALAVWTPAMGQSSPCTVGVQSPASGYWSWTPGSTVKVYVVKARFRETELPFLLAPLTSWNSVSVVTGSGVSFEYKGTTKTRRYCENCLTIERDKVFDQSKRHLTELRLYSVVGSSNFIAWATIVVDPLLTSPRSLTNAVAHELGHSFGLTDCYSCRGKSSVMMQFKGVNVPNEMDGPTACDVARVKAAYQSFTARSRQAVKAKKDVDGGEEPVDDDTPIVVPRPQE